MPDPFFLRLVLWSHVAAGFAALVLAPIAMRVRKGGRSHRRWGKVYFWAMFAVFVTALGVVGYRLATAQHPTPRAVAAFLGLISVLSFYGAFTGYRSLYRKRPERGQSAIWLDWVASVIALVSGAGFVAWGAAQLALPAEGIPPTFAVLSVVFGILLGRDAWADLASYRRPSADPMWWWYFHMERMVGSYIGAVTAFSVQNIGRYLPPEYAWIVWATPGVLGGVLLSIWIKRYRRTFSRGAQYDARRAVVVPSPA